MAGPKGARLQASVTSPVHKSIWVHSAVVLEQVDLEVWDKELRLAFNEHMRLEQHELYGLHWHRLVIRTDDPWQIEAVAFALMLLNRVEQKRRGAKNREVPRCSYSVVGHEERPANPFEEAQSA